MALKSNRELKHLIATSNMEGLNQVIGNYVNDGWNIIEARLIAFDNNSMEAKVFYILGKHIKDD